jgi:glycosyltransferase involved in cell wall biosynthesis
LPTALIDLTVLSSPSRTRGIGRYAADLACALNDAAPRWPGMRLRAVERFEWTGPATLADDLRGAVLRLHAAPLRFSHAGWAYRVRLGLARAVRQAGASLLHSPHPDATPIGPLGCRRVVTCHDLITLKEPAHYSSWKDGWRRGRRLLDARRYRSADHVIAVSDATRRDLIDLLGIDAGKITVVRHGIDLHRFSPTPSAADAELLRRHRLARRSYVLYAGAADWRKNAEGMIAALAAVRCESSDIVLAWAGQLDAAARARIERLAARHGLGDGVRLLGWVPDEELAGLMRGAVCLLFVSRIEGFGYPMLEAMACGCPVVASRRPAAMEMGADAMCAVDPESPGGIAAAVASLAGDCSEWARLAERGVLRSRQFSLARMADETLAVYRRVAAA